MPRPAPPAPSSLPPDRRPAELAALAFALTFPTLAAWLYFLVLSPGPALVAAYFGAKVVQFSFPLLWGVVSRRPAPRPLALERRGIGGGLASGAAIAVLAGAGYALLFRGSEVAALAGPRIRERLESFSADGPLGFLVLGFALAVIHSFLEEYYWRWFGYARLRRMMAGPGSALVVASAGFMGHHVIILYAFLGAAHMAQVALLAASVFAAGALWCWQYERSGGLAAPWISHILADLAILAVGYDLAL